MTIETQSAESAQGPIATVARRRLEHVLVEAGRGLTKMARRMLGRAGESEASDVAQSARERMVRAIRVGAVHPARFQGPDRREAQHESDPWTSDVRRQLFVVLRNLVTDWFRSQKRRPVAAELDAGAVADGSSVSASDRVLVRQHLDALVRAAKISALDREAFIQHELCDRSLDECVEVLCERGFARVDRSTVRNRVLAVKRFLAQCG